MTRLISNRPARNDGFEVLWIKIGRGGKQSFPACNDGFEVLWIITGCGGKQSPLVAMTGLKHCVEYPDWFNPPWSPEPGWTGLKWACPELVSGSYLQGKEKILRQAQNDGREEK
jgi:hypothetical protein